MTNPMIQAMMSQLNLSQTKQQGDGIAFTPLPLRVDIGRAGYLIQNSRSYRVGDGRESLIELEEIVRQSQYNEEDRAYIAGVLAKTIAHEQATVDAKAWACRQLWIIGTPAEITVLGEALKDPALSDMARYALQSMESPEVDDVLIAALEGTPPSVQIGCINSLLERNAPGAADAIKPLRKSKDKGVEAAAKHALGRLDGKIV